MKRTSNTSCPEPKEKKLNYSTAIEKEKRDESLNNPLGTDNKGFTLLSRMGYKEGQSLGKHGSEGIVEPISFSVKLSRAGLGREAALKEIQEARLIRAEAKRRARLADESQQLADFRRRMSRKADERKLKSDLYSCQKSCENLDAKENIETPVYKWFWPQRETVTEEDSESDDTEEQETDEEDELEDDEKLKTLTQYLRTSYLFCYWCGCQFEDPDEMLESCPGPSKDDHDDD